MHKLRLTTSPGRSPWPSAHGRSGGAVVVAKKQDEGLNVASSSGPGAPHPHGRTLPGGVITSAARRRVLVYTQKTTKL